MGNTLNRVGNTVAIPVRLGGTVVVTAADLFVTLKTMGKESLEITTDTAKRVKNVLLGAWNHGKWYHKAMNIPLSPIIAGGTVLEGAVRAVVQPVVNGVVNGRRTGVNTLKNARKGTFGRVFSKKPISDFSYEHLSTRGLKLDNRIENRQVGKGGGSSVGESRKSSESSKDKKDSWRTRRKNKRAEKKASKKTEKANKDSKTKEDEITKLKKKLAESEEENKKLTKKIELYPKQEESESMAA